MHVGRYAPSPTGDLHLGNARTALLAWLWARAAGGRVLLRVEDLDRGRVRAGIEQSQRRDLERIGLDWEGEVVRQSERGELYEAALQRLADADLVYPCFCSRADVRAAAAAPHGPEGPRYPGTCAHLTAGEVARRLASGRPASLRFRVRPGPVRFTDAVHGELVEDVAATSGDLVVRRSDGIVAYQLAVVVDDAAQGVTHVLRGDDLLSSTARQLLLRRALELGPEPAHAHVPLLLGADGARLSKRQAAVGVGEILDAGVTPRRLVGWLAQSAGLIDGAWPLAASDLIETFELARISRASFRVTALPTP